ncbi:MAG: hypothetical protein R6U89_02000 [Dehalococcoidia bacterium]
MALAGALNLSLVCFLLLHAGAGNLTAFAWGFVATVGLVVVGIKLSRV